MFSLPTSTSHFRSTAVRREMWQNKLFPSAGCLAQPLRLSCLQPHGSPTTHVSNLVNRRNLTPSVCHSIPRPAALRQAASLTSTAPHLMSTTAVETAIPPLIDPSCSRPKIDYTTTRAKTKLDRFQHHCRVLLFLSHSINENNIITCLQ